MLKLTASYSKKVPAETEYSSQSYHCCVEIEIAEGLSKSQLDTKIHETFALVRDSVEAELHNGTATSPAQTKSVPQSNTRSNYGKAPARSKEENDDTPASPKQIKFLLDLTRNSKVSLEQIKSRFGVASLEELTKTQCSRAIDEINGKAVA